MQNINLNLPDLLNTHLENLNLYTPTELIPLQTEINHKYLKEEISKKYFFSIINKINHKNILYLFKPEYLLYYILRSLHLQDIFIQNIENIQFLYKEMPKQELPNTNTTFLKETYISAFSSNTLLIYDHEKILNKRIKNILKAVFIIKQFYKLNPQNPTPKSCSTNILLSLLFNMDDYILTHSSIINNKNGKDMTIKNFIKQYKLKPSKEDLKNQDVHYSNSVYNLLRTLEYKHLFLFSYLQDEYLKKQIKDILSDPSSIDINVDSYILNKFQMKTKYFLKMYKMFLLNEDVYYEYAIKEDINNE